MPAVNEQITIEEFVAWCHEGLRGGRRKGEILIVDGSTDATPELALAARRPRAAHARSAAWAGPTSTRSPTSAAATSIMGDADCTYDFRKLAPFVEAMRDGTEFAMGSRWRG